MYSYYLFLFFDFYFIFFFFFFQAEDGIRDVAVTGVQTCALPISVSENRRERPWLRARRSPTRPRSWSRSGASRRSRRSEERRVGKECRSEWSEYREKKKKKKEECR